MCEFSLVLLECRPQIQRFLGLHILIFYHRSSYARFFPHWTSCPKYQPRMKIQCRLEINSQWFLWFCFLHVVCAVVSSATREQLFAIDFGKFLMKVKHKMCLSTVPWGMPDIKAVQDSCGQSRMRHFLEKYLENEILRGVTIVDFSHTGSKYG